MPPRPDPAQVTFSPIGVIHSPFADKASAPRQPAIAPEIAGAIELFPARGFEDALADLDGCDHLWVVFLFHLVTGWRPKVAPPRSVGGRKGVFATRSPHRPNPIGLSAVRLERIDGLVLHVRGIDMVDGSPVLDLKPYVAYTDAIPDARVGWLAETDPKTAWDVRFTSAAESELAFLVGTGVSLRDPIALALALGPEPHAYRRIRRDQHGAVLALKEWRVRFETDAHAIVVTAVRSGYRPRQLAEDPSLAVHRDFVARFGAREETLPARR